MLHGRQTVEQTHDTLRQTSPSSLSVAGKDIDEGEPPEIRKEREIFYGTASWITAPDKFDASDEKLESLHSSLARL